MRYGDHEPSIPLTIAEPDPPTRSSHWQQYLDLLAQRKIPAKAQRYFVRHVEDLIKETDQTPLRSLQRSEVEAFFRRRADNPRLEDWQVGQCVEAIRLVLKDLAGAAICAEIDWDYWRGASRSLEVTHPSLARDEGLEKVVNRATSKAGSKAHGEVLEQLIRAIRARHYSIRTEKAYVDWAARFFAFCKNAGELSLGPLRVQAYLEYLAVERKVSASTHRRNPGQAQSLPTRCRPASFFSGVVSGE